MDIVVSIQYKYSWPCPCSWRPVADHDHSHYTRCSCDNMLSSQSPHPLKGGACICAPPQLYIPLPVRSFGFIARHIRGNRQVPRTHPVLPDEQRSQGDIPCTNQIRMEREMAALTHEDQPLVGAIVRRNIATC